MEVDDLQLNKMEISDDRIRDNLLSESELETFDFTHNVLSDVKNTSQVTLKSNSTCSSRSSHTDDEDLMDEDIMDDKIDEDDQDNQDDKDDQDDEDNNDDNDDDNFEDVTSEDDDEDEYEDEIINATIKKFPIQNTLLQLIIGP